MFSRVLAEIFSEIFVPLSNTPMLYSNTMKSIGSIGTLLHHKGSTVWSISPEDTVFEAIQFLAEKNIGALLVMDGPELIGIFSERDYTRKVALEGRSSRETQVKEIIST